MDKAIRRLLKEIAQEGARLSIKYDEEKDDLIFIFSVQGEEFREVLKHSVAVMVEDNKLLLTYVLGEILSVIKGIKEEAENDK